MKRIERIVFATNNAHKLKEARAILGGDVALISLSELGCEDDIPETSDTLEGNSLQKARWVHERYGVDCIADDTGLMVDALGGAPGVLSARYAGPGHDSAANMAKLLREMDGKEDRKAHFSTVLSLVTSEGECTFEGRVDGRIAESPDGDAGFGYDPVFIADETGETFARMGEESKNAISHRGRAFRKFRDWLGTLSVILMILLGVWNAQAAQWRQHPSYDGKAFHILPGEKYTYFLMLKQDEVTTGGSTQRFGQILRFDNENEEWLWLDKGTGLSENVVVDACYDYANKQLAVCYDNGNIDLVKDNGEKINIPGLMGASGASTNIVDINVDPEDGDIWVTTSTGYLRINSKKGEVSTSRDYGRRINSVAKHNGQLFVATPDGLYYGDQRESTLNNFERIEAAQKVQRLRPLTTRHLLSYAGDSWNRLLYMVTPLEEGGYNYGLRSLKNEFSLEMGKDGAITSGTDYIRWIRATRSNIDYPLPPGISNGAVAGSIDGKTIWVVDGRKGISRYKAPENGGNWTLTLQQYMPNASNAFRSVAMTYHTDYGLLVRNHGGEQEFLQSEIATPDLISGLKGTEWTPLSTTYRIADADRVLLTDNPYGIAVDPHNRNHVYSGSRTQGLLRLDLSEPKKSMRFGKRDDAAMGKSGFVGIVDAIKTWPEACTFLTPVFDAAGNLWVSRNNQDEKRAELWYWTPESRAATTSTSTYRQMGRIQLSDVTSSDYSKILPLTRSGRTNMLIFDGGTPTGPIMVLDHGGTLSSRGDDKRVIIATLIDQDGQNFNYGRINSITEDPGTGRVWMTCNSGVFHFDPKEALEGNTTVRRVKVPRNDGTNLADYLLDGATVSCLTIDKQGRKWFGTFGAGVVITGSDGTEIVRTYTTSNSELADDIVHGICYNPQNNSMMISTGKGLSELFLDAMSDGTSSDVRAYPNPVRPGFMGVVTIDNLADYCMVKIMDASGNLVKELGQAPSGEIEWDLTNNKHKRVMGGVYYILATNGSEQDSYTKKGKILVIE